MKKSETMAASDNCRNVLPIDGQILQPRKLYLPALVIVAVILLLLVFIGFSTYWNLDRARNNTLRFVHQQGEAVIDVLETGLRSVAGTPENRRITARLIEDAGKSDAVAYAYISDREGNVLYRSETFSADEYGTWKPNFIGDSSVSSRILQVRRGTPVYEVASPLQDFSAPGQKGAVLVVGLEMQTYAAARHEDFHHAIIMVSILFALASGAVFFIYVIHRYHRMNLRLKQARDYTRQVVDNMANGLLSIDAQGRVISWNNLGLNLLGIDPPGSSETDLKRVLDFDSTGIRETMESGTPVLDREITVVLPGGRKLPVALSVTPIFSQAHRCTGAVIIIRDLREIKRLEEKIRRTEQLAALGKMAAAVAHEIRNPLSSIRGFAQFLRHVLNDREKEREYATIMIREVDRMNRVVTDLLNFARPLELNAKPVDPAEVVTHTVRLVKADAKARGIDIRMHTESRPKQAEIDSNLMTQVMLNLLLNAFQAVDDSGRVDVEVGSSPDARHVIFRVEDDGPGIDAGNLDRVFDPFFTTREKGTGLGLAIVQKIVENHQGEVRVESPVEGRERGCRFIISIPVRLREESN